MKIGTRGSALALWQARTVARLIEAAGGPPSELVVIRTSGDERAGPPDPPIVVPLNTSDSRGPLSVQRPGPPENVKRLFVKEIEEALLEGRIDIAVHSAKDLPAAIPDGLRIAAALEREDPRDVLILPKGTTARGLTAAREALGRTPRLGTSSVRRRAELSALFPGAVFEAIRGNVDTRLRKLDSGDCDALVLAAAGVKRLGFDARITALLPVDACVPAPGQGIVAVETREDASEDVRRTTSAISDADALAALIAERAVVHALGGGCQMPLGALATIDEQRLVLQGVVASVDGARSIRATASGNRGNPQAVGEKLARLLLERGAATILAGTPGT